MNIKVNIWGWRGLGIGWGGVGHVMVTDENSTVSFLSQFPHGEGGTAYPWGPNRHLNIEQTLHEEGNRESDVEFILPVQADRFLEKVSDHLKRPYWCWDPSAPLQTHCARSAYEAIRAGGVNIDPEGQYLEKNGEAIQILPNRLWHLLESTGTKKFRTIAINLSKENLDSIDRLVREELLKEPSRIGLIP